MPSSFAPVCAPEGLRACRSSFNGYAVYITWLLASLVYHVPSLQDLGINVKADLSVFFLCFVTTITVRTTPLVAVRIASQQSCLPGTVCV